MKRTSLVMLFISLMIFACKKNKDTVEDGPGEIYGRWKLTETLADPGDGSGRYMKVKGNPQYLNLERSGQMNGDALSDLQTFKILDSVTMEVYSKSYMRSIPYRYKVSARSLTLNPPCFEGCGYRFVRE
ncbi:hypothetical protein EZ449_13685 [Pedobacter frigidisoli]|uniref:Lipocalin-like domain-containing protein n=1 Tax=Pedobacter frigidisoli TaxID=2530455 RepID=A0A4R0P1V7_9SPHI|nr:hypothetical protein [Pedobacter frigidisoli]TCD07587.1 hypothetical protein EZ449_13685 [Pedobacter frigidisoli]